MKDVLAFLKWHWSKWSFTQRLFLVGAGLLGFGVPDLLKTGEMNMSIRGAFIVWSVIFLKWFVWDATVYSWNQFKKERKELFETIKGE